MKKIVLLPILIFLISPAFADTSTDCTTDAFGNVHCTSRNRSSNVQVIQGTPRQSTAARATNALQSFVDGYQEGQERRRENELHEVQMRLLAQQNTSNSPEHIFPSGFLQKHPDVILGNDKYSTLVELVRTYPDAYEDLDRAYNFVYHNNSCYPYECRYTTLDEKSGDDGKTHLVLRDDKTNRIIEFDYINSKIERSQIDEIFSKKSAVGASNIRERE